MKQRLLINTTMSSSEDDCIVLEGRIAKRSAIPTNHKGLHARAAARVSRLVEAYNVHNVNLVFLGILQDEVVFFVPANSIMGMMMMAVNCGTQIEIVVCGAKPEALADSLMELINSGFGEVY